MILGACSAEPGARRAASPEVPPILSESWRAYVRHFIQQDGRVIDHSAGGISTSEGQSYAMLRAVWINDRDTFDRTWQWALRNLSSGVRNDHLWAWKWGKSKAGRWGVLDTAFATDADEDAAFALILAAQQWGDQRYLNAARAVLDDLWRLGTKEVNGRIYLLAGDTLCNGSQCRINPSYYAPYAYRAFGRVDRSHPWSRLVDTTYTLLEGASQLTGTRLPPDWLWLDTVSGDLRLVDEKSSSFSYDAIRTPWRIALDDRLSSDERSSRYLRRSLGWLTTEWMEHRHLAAIISPRGKALAGYESPEMLGVLMAALKPQAPKIAGEMNARVSRLYRNGVWSEADRYYLQNWLWFGTALYLDFYGALRVR